MYTINKSESTSEDSIEFIHKFRTRKIEHQTEEGIISHLSARIYLLQEYKIESCVQFRFPT